MRTLVEQTRDEAQNWLGDLLWDGKGTHEGKVELRFPAGRYHATPWGRHVNEGADDLFAALHADTGDLQAAGADATIRQLTEREQPYRVGDRRFRSLQFLTARHDGHGSRGQDSGAAFTITFLEERSGPFALGYGCHFGLGLFVPVEG